MELILHSASDIFKTAQVELGVARARPKPMMTESKPMDAAAQTPTEQMGKGVYDGWKRSLKGGRNPRTGQELTPQESASLQQKITAWETANPPAAATEETSEAVPPVEPVEQAGAGLSGVTPEIDQAATGDNDGDGVNDAAAAQGTAEVANAAKATGVRSMSEAQFAKMLHDPQYAEQALEMYRGSHPQFATGLEEALKKYQWAANPQPTAGDGNAENALANAGAGAGAGGGEFKVPDFAKQFPGMSEQMQGFNDENQRNQQFDEFVKTNNYTPQQIAALRQQMNGQPGQQQPQQNDPSFWGSVGRGAGVGGVGGAAVGGLPGAAVGAGAGGLAGAGNWAYNKGKNLWNQFQNFRNQGQQQPQHPMGAPRMGSSKPNLFAYAGSAQQMMKYQNSEEEDRKLFLQLLDENDGELFKEFVDQQISEISETSEIPEASPLLATYDRKVTTASITAYNGSALSLFN